jgi:hypothetical protein
VEWVSCTAAVNSAWLLVGWPGCEGFRGASVSEALTASVVLVPFLLVGRRSDHTVANFTLVYPVFVCLFVCLFIGFTIATLGDTVKQVLGKRQLSLHYW